MPQNARLRTALEKGQTLPDAALASEILDNRLLLPGIVLYYVIGAVGGLTGIGALVIALSPSGQHSHYEKGLILSPSPWRAAEWRRGTGAD